MPVHNHLVVRLIKIKKSKLAQMDNALGKESLGEIVGIPLGLHTDGKMLFKVTDRIVFNDMEAVDVPEIDGVEKDLLLIHIDDVLAIINN